MVLPHSLPCLWAACRLISDSTCYLLRAQGPTPVSAPRGQRLFSSHTDPEPHTASGTQSVSIMLCNNWMNEWMPRSASKGMQVLNKFLVIYYCWKSRSQWQGRALWKFRERSTSHVPNSNLSVNSALHIQPGSLMITLHSDSSAVLLCVSTAHRGICTTTLSTEVMQDGAPKKKA